MSWSGNMSSCIGDMPCTEDALPSIIDTLSCNGKGRRLFILYSGHFALQWGHVAVFTGIVDCTELSVILSNVCIHVGLLNSGKVLCMVNNKTQRMCVHLE